MPAEDDGSGVAPVGGEDPAADGTLWMEAAMTAEDVVRTSLAAWNAGDRAGHRATLADDAVVKEHGTGREIVGGDEIAAAHFAWRDAFPGMRGDIENLVAHGDQVVYETTWTGTHAGPLTAPDGQTIPPTGRSVAMPACLVVRVADDRIVEQHHYFDMVTMLSQLGLMPGAD
ncbi:MAG: ester cyclase [Thermoleophilia bacterium]